MKNFFCLALVAFIVLSCSERESFIVPSGKNFEFTAYQEGAPQSKTIVMPESAKVYWEPGDDIKVFCGNQSALFSSSLESESQIAAFSGSFSGDINGAEGFWALYPYSDDASFDGESIITVLPSLQMARKESFAPGANITVARSYSNHLQFYNVAGGLRFTLSEDGVKIITLESMSGQALAGRIKIGFENDLPTVRDVMEGSSVVTISPPDGNAFETGVWYYITIIPGSKIGGVKMTFFKSGGVSGSFVSSKDLSIKRSAYSGKKQADSFVDAWIDNNPVVHVCDEPEEQDFEIVEAIDDNTFLARTDSESTPHVGDYMVSGPTDFAPCGYLLRVLDVQSIETRGAGDYLHIKTGNATIDEVIGDIALKGSIDISFSDLDLDYALDEEGNELTFVKEEQVGWTVFDHTFTLDDFIFVTPEVSFYPEKISLIYDFGLNGTINKLGFVTSSSVRLKVTTGIRAGSGYDRTIPLWSYVFKPYKVWIGKIPVVITPVFNTYINFKADGYASFQFVPIKQDFEIQGDFVYDFASHSLAPSERETMLEIVPKSNFFNFEEGYMPGIGFEINGGVSASLGASLSAGLYGCNYTKERIHKFPKGRPLFAPILADALTLEAKAFVDWSLNGKFSFKQAERPDDYNVTDDCDYGLYARATGHLFANCYDCKKDVEPFGPLPLYESDILKSFFFSKFDKLSISLKNNYSGNYLNVSARKLRPLFGYLITEADYGFCYEDTSSKTIKYLNLRDYYGDSRDALYEFMMQADIPLSEFNPEKVYRVAPFIKLKDGSIIHRHLCSESFKINASGDLSTANLDDLPGENL